MDPKRLIADAKSIVVLTGAGISAESGIPTFRGAGGLWRQFRPEDLATPGAFARDPKLVWEWYDWRRELVAQAQPNAGHKALVAIAAGKEAFTLITQNVDDLHERAGSQNVLHVHGSIFAEPCTRCGHRYSALKEHRCAACGSLTRPGVVWFGEMPPEDVWAMAETAVRNAGLLLVVGTSAQVYPAAGLIDLARASGSKVIEVNPDQTPFSHAVDISERGPAGEVLPRWVEGI